jgi:glycine cleavage system aminomethyltransferase T
MNWQEPSDLNNTVRISARRFEESPYVAAYETDAMVRGVYAGRFFPVFNGADPVEEYWLLRRKAAIFDVPEKPVEISGPDALPFLDKVLSRKVSNLKEGRGLYAIACTPQGGVFMDGVLFKLGESRYWYVQADGAFETWLLAHSEGFDVTISDPHSRVLQIQGPASMDIMHAASDGKIDESMKYFKSGFFDLGGQELYVSRTGFTGELGYEIYSQGDATDARALWEHLMNAGEPFGMAFSSTASMTARRIEAGILGNLTDMDPSTTPFQVGLEPFIDMDKENFVGRTALLNADRRTLQYGLKCSDAFPGMGSVVMDGEREVGHLTAGHHSPTLNCGIAYARFNEPGEWTGRAMSLRSTDGKIHACEIINLPFIDPERNIVRGIDRTIP